MNSVVTLTTGKTLDVKLVKSYVVDAPIGKPAQALVTLTNGKTMKVSIQDLECIETFRRELNQIKHEE
jgi:helix-turn-helix protein